ncbi:ABC transporter ATP-binding protein [Rhizosaccharibacter radicis]|uniref:ABC transporter ATP-binding protein n=1 Tax=Rhizosaccharibacter radicis TaxID=2782605 RepID=A0ABT1W0N1_9PROT|nr:ABC transporter ATP-binding protein [Acetobacteraceae bacterium KSS12]
MSEIVLRGVGRAFGATQAVQPTDFTFPDGSVTCLLGPSGCGKTTLMRMIAGLDTPTGGRILFDGRDVTGKPARDRDVAMVFQYPVMYRTLSVAENVELALRDDRRLSAAGRRARVDEVLEVMQLQDRRAAGIDALDVGTRQRVAVARAVARDCAVILFDEPTTNVEVHAKTQLIRAFKQFRARLRQTIIYVTHDQTEAMTLADRIALMRDGAITQCDAPHALYDRPESAFGGWFLGNPGMNFLEPRPQGGVARFDGFPSPFRLPDGDPEGLQLGIRPERILVGPAGALPVPAQVLRRAITVGGQYLLLLRAGSATLRARTPPRAPFAPGDTVSIECPISHAAFFRHGQRLVAQPRMTEDVHA